MRGHGHYSLIPPYSSRRVLDKKIYCPIHGTEKSSHCGRCSSPETSNPHEPRLYTVVFNYDHGKSEVVKTVARSPSQAMRFGMIRRKYQGIRPTKVVVKNVSGIEIAAIAVPATIAAIGIAIPLIQQFLKRPPKERKETEKLIREHEPKIRSLVEREIQKELTRRQKAEATTTPEPPPPPTQVTHSSNPGHNPYLLPPPPTPAEFLGLPTPKEILYGVEKKEEKKKTTS